MTKMAYIILYTPEQPSSLEMSNPYKDNTNELLSQRIWNEMTRDLTEKIPGESNCRTKFCVRYQNLLFTQYNQSLE